MAICQEFVTDRRQRVVFDGSASEWITVVSRLPQGSVLGPLLFILYTDELFDLFENRMSSYAEDSTILAAVVVVVLSQHV